MKLTNERIMTFMGANLTDKKLPIKLGYSYSINRNACEPFFKECENKRNEILYRHAKKDKDGNIVRDTEVDIISIEDMNAFTAEMTELLTIEVEVPIATVSVEVLEKCDAEMFDSLSVAEISSIAFMIEN